MKNDVSLPSKSNKQKQFFGILKVTDEKSRFRIGLLEVRTEDPDPDPYQEVMDP